MKWLAAFIAACITLIAMVYIIWGMEKAPVERSFPATLKVSAYHSESYAPDDIIWKLRINLMGQDRNMLMAQLKTRVAQLSEFAETLNIPKDSLVTSQFSLDKNWNWNNGKRTFSGFELSQNIKVTLPDPSKVSRFSEGLAMIADMEILETIPVVRDRQVKENQILQTATEKATAKAKVLAKAAGKKLGDVRNLSDEPTSEEFVQDQGFLMKASLGSRRASNDFLPQKISLGSTVYIVFDLD